MGEEEGVVKNGSRLFWWFSGRGTSAGAKKRPQKRLFWKIQGGLPEGQHVMKKSFVMHEQFPVSKSAAAPRKACQELAQPGERKVGGYEGKKQAGGNPHPLQSTPKTGGQRRGFIHSILKGTKGGPLHLLETK